MNSAGPSPSPPARRAGRARDGSPTHPGRRRAPHRARPRSIPPLRLGILGCGRLAREVHLPALEKVPQLDVVAASDPDAYRLHDTADRYLIQGRYTDDRELLANPAVEAVAVFVPAARRTGSVLRALEAGKDVFLARPGCLEPEEAQRMAAMATARGRLIQVGLPLRWHRSVRGALELLRARALGPLELLSSRGTVPAAGDSGALFEAALEHFDLWRHLLDADVETISLRVPNGRPKTGDETVTISAMLAGGIRARARLGAGALPSTAVSVRGKRGRLSLECSKGGGLRLHGDVEPPGNGSPWPVSGVRGLVGRLTRLTRGEVLLRRRNGDALIEANRAQWRAFGQSILLWQPAPCQVPDIAGALEALHAARRSLRSGGKPVDVTTSRDPVSP